MSTIAYVAFDLGAESGRAMLASLEDDHLELEPVHRFANLPCHLPSGYHWNLLDLWANLVEGLRQCGATANRSGLELIGVGVDTWGLDFGLLGKSGQLLGLPFCYRDQSHRLAMDKAIQQVSRETIYEATGIQIMPINTLYQLIARNDAEPGLLAHADRLLNMPDLLHYFLCGHAANEATIASTTQMVDPRTGQWHHSLVKDLSIPTQFLKSITNPGTVLGKLRDQVATDADIDPIDVIAPASHDTASAVAAVPAEPQGKWAYLSSGTWSLMGAELDEPNVTGPSMQANFTNELGVDQKVRFLKNLIGLWLVQEVRRDFSRRGDEMDYAMLTDLAAGSEPFKVLIDTHHEPFHNPGQMCEKINIFASRSNQPQLQSPGQYVRCCLESLALTYRQTLDQLEELLNCRFDRLHIVGGGARNELLNQMTADAINRPVYAGPFEATAIGNALTQAMGSGRVKDLAHLRRIVRQSFAPKMFNPRDPGDFECQIPRFKKLTN